MEHIPPPLGAQLVIDRRISDLEAAMCELHHQRNKLSPSSRISSELLGNIFVLAAPKERFYTYGKQLVTSQYGFSVTSRHWRCVALSTPAIWHLIVLEYPNWARLCLERSKNICLTVEGSLYSERMHSPKPLLALATLEQHARIRVLRLSVHDQELARNLLRVLTSRASVPHLQCCKICCSPHSTSSSEPGLQPILSLQDTTRLSELDVIGCGIDWTMHLRGLTSLKIRSIPNRPSCVEFFGALSQMHQLKTLDLDHAWPSDDADAWSHQQPLQFSQLKHMRLTTSIDDAVYLRPFPLITAGCAVDLIFEGAEPDGDLLPSDASISTIASSVDRFFNTALQDRHTLHYNTLLISHDLSEDTFVLVNCWRNSWPECARHRILREDRPDFSLRIRWNSCSQTLIRSIASVLPLASLKALLLFVPIDQEQFMTSFGSLTHLDALMVDRQSGAAIVNVLTSPSSPAHQLAFSRLKTMGFDGMVFSSRRVTAEQLKDVIAARHEQGTRLNVLLVRKAWNIYAKDIKALEELVPVVKWDGRQSYTDDEPCYSYEEYPDQDDIVFPPPRTSGQPIRYDPDAEIYY